MDIRLMNRADVLQIAELEKQCFCDPWSEQSIASELDNSLSCWLVAVEGERILGYVGSQTVLDGSDMMNIAVDPKYRRTGIANKLIDALISKVQQKGACCLALEVRISNEPAVKLYQKMGFQIVGKRPNYYRNPREDAFIMRKDW